ncbi:MAG: DNA repair protein RadC [Nitrosomonas sp.]|nr:DNA repair protein RadC [Nitrosomonas sp.]
MNTHQPDISDNSSNWKLGDPYENIETRPGTTEKQKEAGRCAYTDLLEAHARWAGGTLLGCNFPKDFRKQGGTTLINQSIKSGRDLAMMAQILRDPRFETFRIFYTQQQRIVHHTAITSRLPGAIYLEGIGHGKHNLGEFLENTKRQVHADGYWVLHNHPSGRAEPSIQDVRLTVHLSSSVPGFKGHVVINTNEYSVIDQDGQVDHVNDMGNLAGGYKHNPFKHHELLLKKISSPQDLARIGQALKQRDQFFQLIGVSANSSVMSITELPISLLDRSKSLLLARLQNFARNSGVNAVFAITDSHHFKHPVLVVACQAGILRDVLTADGAKYRSMQEEAIFPSVGGEISSCYRKPRSFMTENDGIIKSKGRGVRL